MKYIDALLALKEGRCAYIECLDSGICYMLEDDIIVAATNSSKRVNPTATEQLGYWELVECKVKYEEVEETRFVIIKDDGTEVLSKIIPPPTVTFITLIGTSFRKIKPKVKHREELVINVWPVRAIGNKDVPEDVKIYAEWEE